MPNKGTGYCLTIAALAVVLLVAGCPKSSADQGAPGFRYPATWPLPKLTAPAGAVQIKVYDTSRKSKDGGWTIDGDTMAKGAAQERTLWEVAFEFGKDPQQLQAHLDQCLKLLGFELWLAGNLPAERRRYISRDRKQQVEIEYVSLQPPPEAKAEAWQGYDLRVTAWATPRPDVPSTQPIP